MEVQSLALATRCVAPSTLHTLVLQDVTGLIGETLTLD